MQCWRAGEPLIMVGCTWEEDVAFELDVAKLALELLVDACQDCHIQLKSDNTTSVTHINKMWGSPYHLLIVISSKNLHHPGLR